MFLLVHFYLKNSDSIFIGLVILYLYKKNTMTCLLINIEFLESLIPQYSLTYDDLCGVVIPFVFPPVDREVSQNLAIQHFLVGGIPTPLKKLKVGWENFQYMVGFVPNIWLGLFPIYGWVSPRSITFSRRCIPSMFQKLHNWNKESSITCICFSLQIITKFFP